MSPFVFVLSLAAMAVLVRISRKRFRWPLLLVIVAGLGHASLWTAYSFIAIGYDIKAGYMIEVMILSLSGVLSLVVASLAAWVPGRSESK